MLKFPSVEYITEFDEYSVMYDGEERIYKSADDVTAFICGVFGGLEKVQTRIGIATFPTFPRGWI